MDIRKLLGISKPKRRAGVAQAGVYAQELNPEGVDPEMRRTLGLKDEPAESLLEEKRRQIVTQDRAAGRSRTRFTTHRRLY